jgi:hypothetical protein
MFPLASENKEVLKGMCLKRPQLMKYHRLNVCVQCIQVNRGPKSLKNASQSFPVDIILEIKPQRQILSKCLYQTTINSSVPKSLILVQWFPSLTQHQN